VDRTLLIVVELAVLSVQLFLTPFPSREKHHLWRHPDEDVDVVVAQPVSTLRRHRPAVWDVAEVPLLSPRLSLTRFPLWT